jgi:hypothetical protein
MSRGDSLRDVNVGGDDDARAEGAVMRPSIM